jgi:hypothetical protein
MLNSLNTTAKPRNLLNCMQRNTVMLRTKKSAVTGIIADERRKKIAQIGSVHWILMCRLISSLSKYSLYVRETHS